MNQHDYALLPEEAVYQGLGVRICLYIVFMFAVFAGGCGRGVSTKAWERLETSTDGLELYVAEGRTRDLTIPVSDTSDCSLVHFELVNRGRVPVTIEPDLVTTCGCVQASADKSKLAPGEACKITASLSHAPTAGQRTISLDLIVTSPQHSLVTLLLNVTYAGDWVASAKSLPLKGIFGSQSEQSFEVNGSQAALDALTWTVSGNVKLRTKRTSASQWVLTASCQVDSLLREQIAGTIYLKTTGGSPASLEIPVTQRAEPLGTWSPKAIVIAADRPEARCEIRLVDGTVIQHLAAPGLVLTPLHDQPTTFLVSVDGSEAFAEVHWVTATVARGSWDQQIKLPVLVQHSSETEQAVE